MEDKKRGATTKKTPTDHNNSINDNRQSINKETETIRGGTFGALRFGQTNTTTEENPAEMKGDTGVTPLTREQGYIVKRPLHKQARSYLKTTASLVGKDTSGQKSLFEIPHFDTEINPYKEVLTKMTAITGNLLIALWQANKDESGVLTIKNLSDLARQLKTTPQELKLYLIYLGGYQIPITKAKVIKEGKKRTQALSLYHDKIFRIEFNIRLKDNEKESDFNNDERIGTRYLNFIRNREIYSVEVTPSSSLQEELQGKGLGNILVDDSFVAFCLGLSDLAYKLFCFSGSNVPTFKIGFKKLISKKYLNIETQVYGEYRNGKRVKSGAGKTRMINRIKTALDELEERGHLKKWEYEEDGEFFKWSFTDTVFKHKELLKTQAETLKLPEKMN